jgi:hypothetical protein
MSFDPAPKVKGRLAETEATILRLLKAEGPSAIYRTSVSIDAVIALAAVRAANKERRDSLSNLFAAALAEYTEDEAAAVIASEEAALLLQAKRLGVDVSAVLRTAVLSISPATAQAGRPVPGGEHAASGDPAEILRTALSEAQQEAATSTPA